MTNLKTQRPYLNKILAGTSAAVLVCATVGSILTKPDSPSYRALKKPTWQPPAPVFPVAWTALYADIAVVNGLVLTDLVAEKRNREARSLATALGVNLALNAGWSGVFFRANRFWLSAVWAGVLAGSSWDLVRRAAASSPARGAALAPYGLWTTFATALSTRIAQLNR
ncbi:TspO/MBR family protein [Corynebacterium guangdongense]|uniref:Tryptophan-rich sensory protein n=1 Tax=Corynebacterium guangdongense TaxID=1783348 RepID=A0ABU1ZYD8_9CORY|nr:TspO/MBR family protein [Corynebacterium guangdongense]MDR7329940.1 tryptophan-rich sensory protein [Corynebacterium guangdongense]WJZ18498.1 TspO/MBR family protein [Corynebacterium guangdongense]